MKLLDLTEATTRLLHMQSFIDERLKELNSIELILFSERARVYQDAKFSHYLNEREKNKLREESKKKTESFLRFSTYSLILIIVILILLFYFDISDIITIGKSTGTIIILYVIAHRFHSSYYDLVNTQYVTYMQLVDLYKHQIIRTGINNVKFEEEYFYLTFLNEKKEKEIPYLKGDVSFFLDHDKKFDKKIKDIYDDLYFYAIRIAVLNKISGETGIGKIYSYQ